MAQTPRLKRLPSPDDLAAADELCSRNDKLAYWCVKRTLGLGEDSPDFPDAVQEARFAMYRAALAYDPTIAKFATYATRAMQTALWRWLELHERYGFARVGSSKKCKVRRFAERPLSLDAPLGCDGDGAGTLAREDPPLDPDADPWALWRVAFAVMPARWALVLLGRVVDGRTFAELGAALGVSRTAVQQIEGKARRRLRLALEAYPEFLPW